MVSVFRPILFQTVKCRPDRLVTFHGVNFLNMIGMVDQDYVSSYGAHETDDRTVFVE